MKTWYCKIGETNEENLEKWNGADLPMRQAIEKAYLEVTGEQEVFLFSGWGAQLSKLERAEVENRPPVDTEFDIKLKEFDKLMHLKNESSPKLFSKWIEFNKLLEKELYENTE